MSCELAFKKIDLRIISWNMGVVSCKFMNINLPVTSYNFKSKILELKIKGASCKLKV